MRNAARDGDMGSELFPDPVFVDWLVGVVATDGELVLQRHCCLRGMAAVTPAHPQFLLGGCGHELNGRPGFRTGTMRRSLAWVHFVDRWPRIQGSQAIFCPFMSGMTLSGT